VEKLKVDQILKGQLSSHFYQYQKSLKCTFSSGTLCFLLAECSSSFWVFLGGIAHPVYVPNKSFYSVCSFIKIHHLFYILFQIPFNSKPWLVDCNHFIRMQANVYTTFKKEARIHTVSNYRNTAIHG
jgi:hypothetical protein